MVDPDATTEPTAAPDNELLDRMRTRGWEFDFFQAIWLLQRYHADREPVGHRGPVAREVFRFRPNVSMGFPPTDVRRLIPVQAPYSEELFYRLEATFLGLYGVATPLPLHYAVRILRAVYRQDGSLLEEPTRRLPGDTEVPEREPGSTPVRDFLDIFHHRLISLFYRSWAKYRYHVTFSMRQHDEVTDYLLWLIGSSPEWKESTLGVRPIRLLRYAGVLTQHPKSAVTLEGVLFDYWRDIRVAVESFVGRWVPLKRSDLNGIGTVNSSPGIDLTVGERVYDITGAFNIVLGPVDWATYTTFLPDGQRYAETRSVVRLYCTDPLSFSIEIKIRERQIPALLLSSDDRAGRLGYTSWVRTDEMPETSVAFGVN